MGDKLKSRPSPVASTTHSLYTSDELYQTCVHPRVSAHNVHTTVERGNVLCSSIQIHLSSRQFSLLLNPPRESLCGETLALISFHLPPVPLAACVVRMISLAISHTRDACSENLCVSLDLMARILQDRIFIYLYIFTLIDFSLPLY